MKHATDPKDRSPAVKHAPPERAHSAHHIDTPAEALERVDAHPVGTGVGAVSGAAVGAVAGLAAGPLGSLAGAVVGGLAGGLIGSGSTASPVDMPGAPITRPGEDKHGAERGDTAAPGHENTTPCPTCGGTGVIGAEFEACLTCRGTGRVAHLGGSSSG